MKKVAKTIFTCDKCGKEIEYTTKNEYDANFDFAANECWEIRLGRAGYGSKMDGSDINFDVCDNCLYDFIHTFNPEGQKRVLNSGSNTCYDIDADEEWEDDDLEEDYDLELEEE